MTTTLITLLVFVWAFFAAGDNAQWKTLNGDEPLVVARGGFSGIFPHSSSKAYEWAGLLSLPNVLYWCDIQVTRDNILICVPNIRLENSSNIDFVYESGKKTYYVNSVRTEGWFSLDFTFAELSKVVLTQAVSTRPQIFNQNQFPVLTVENVANQSSPHGLWLNIQHDSFYALKHINMSYLVLSLLESTNVTYISSPELTFLKSIHPRTPKKTKLIFSFKGDTDIEPSTNVNYVSLLRNLSIIKEFVAGIIVPKHYIYPVGKDNYLVNSTSVVLAAHRAGLEVFASSFANDDPYAFDFSYDPMEEYLKFIDNGVFSVDGVISDFPITPSAAIACYSNMPKDVPAKENLLVISSKGSSGNFAGCTDAAYQRAISDGVDVLDCPVQMTRDGVAICLGSISLSESTNVAKSNYSRLAENVPELGSGIFSFSLTWTEIQSLTPSLSEFCLDGKCFPHEPRHSKAGTFMKLSEFLVLANKTSSIVGVLISVEHSSYLAEKQNLLVADSVLGTLQNASMKMKRVMIQSRDEYVLLKFKKASYETVYKASEVQSEANFSSISQIGNFASSVVVSKASVYHQNGRYLLGKTDIVKRFHAASISVFVELFQNEFITQAFDFMSDPYIEINSFAILSLVDGVITEYPATAAKYKGNRCLGLANNTPPYMLPVLPGDLLRLQVDPEKDEIQPRKKKTAGKKALDVLFWIAVAILSIWLGAYILWNVIQMLQWHLQIYLLPEQNFLGFFCQWCFGEINWE